MTDCLMKRFSSLLLINPHPTLSYDKELTDICSSTFSIIIEHFAKTIDKIYITTPPFVEKSSA